MRLKDKVAIVTGGGRGIGRVTCLVFGREGAKVVVADVDEKATTDVAKEITDAGGQALAVTVDISKAESVQAMVAKAKEWGGSVDVLVNNAGITRDARLVKMTGDQWDAVINVNLKGTWLCGQVVAPIMVEQKSGSIINVSSIVGVYGNFGQSNYAATKAGVIAMAKTWARELGPSGVRVNAVAPGFIATEMVTTIPEKVIEDVKAKTPLRRLGQPEDMANIYLFLASEESSFVHGTVIQADGGISW